MTTIAQQIAQQLGGSNRIAAMTGAKNFVALETGLRFQLPKSTYVTITVNGADLYDVKIEKLNNRTFETRAINTAGNVAVADLMSTLERLTSLRFSL